MQENCSLIVLGKEDGKGEGGITIREGRMGWGWGGGEQIEGITKLKKKVISAATEKKQCVLLGEACLAPVPEGGCSKRIGSLHKWVLIVAESSG